MTNADPGALPDVAALSVGILGGHRPEGRAWPTGSPGPGSRVLLGSRSSERGAQAASDLAAQPGVVASTVDGGDNAFACTADVVIVAVPWRATATCSPSWPRRSPASWSSTASTRSASTNRALSNCRVAEGSDGATGRRPAARFDVCAASTT